MTFAESEMQRMSYNPQTRLNINLDPEGLGLIQSHELFGQTENGDLVIYMANLKGIIRVIKDGKRYRPKHVIKNDTGRDLEEFDHGAKGEGLDLFVPPIISKLYKAGKKIKHLIISDDPVTAMILCNYDIYTVAIPGITHIKESIFPAHIAEQLTDLCEVCEISKLTYLAPSNVTEVIWDDKIDLAIRPTRIFNSLWNLYIKVGYIAKVNIYFAYPQSTSGFFRACGYFSDPTALDYIAEFKKELNTKDPGTGKLVIHDLTMSPKISLVKKIFAIEGKGSEFYEQYASVIGLNEFIFNRGLYQYDFDAGKAIYKKSIESSQFFCASGTFFLRGIKINKYGVKTPIIERFEDNSFQKKFSYMSKDQINNLKRDIAYYDTLGCRPDHINYQQYWTDYNEETGAPFTTFNTYSKLLHKPEKGDFELISNLIKHIFGSHEILYKGKKYLGWHLGLDYCKLLYCNPTHFLPILCTVSEDRKTGKTTFWDLIKQIFGNNSVPITDNDINSQFTSLYAGKLIGIFEEAMIDKIPTLERVKDLVTAETCKLERKGKDAFMVDNFLKIGIASNKINNFAIIDKKEVRFWVRDIPRIEVNIQSFKQKLFSQIPAFLFHLREAEYYTENEDPRAWFADELIQTDALENVKLKSRPQKEILVEKTVINYMLEFNLTWCKLSAKDIRDLINDRDLTMTAINYILENKWNKIPNRRNNKYTYYTQHKSSIHPSGFEISEDIKKTEHYEFSLSEFCTPREIIQDEYTLKQIIEMEEHEYNAQHAFWKNVLWDDFIKIKKFNDLNIDLDQLKEIYLECKSLKQFESKFNEHFNQLPF